MKRIAFTLIGGKKWVGGYNYQINLFSTLSAHEADRVQVCLFLGLDVEQEIINRFKLIPNIEIIQSEVFNKKNKRARLIKAILFGKDTKALNLFNRYQIDVAFEVASFYGWRFPIPTIAWIPDFQHHHLPQFFSKYAFWKRELGFRAQILCHRIIMLSSNDALADYNKFYPKIKSAAHVVKFAVSAEIPKINIESLLKLYGLPKRFFFLPNQFWEHKNHGCVIEALKICRDRGESHVVAVTGNQISDLNRAYYSDIKLLVDSNNLSQHFRLLGVIPYEHIHCLMLATDALINPSKFEGWSTTVEEAKSFGIELILSDLNVHKEQASNRAYFFNPDSPEQLASILGKFNSSSDAQKDILHLTAIADAKKRVGRFAEIFADLVEITARSKSNGISKKT